ncbi:hydrogenase expression/formation protein HypE [Clostridium tagluense]|uniref:hydrogenase expression/formation protein HypE n=1 Tax=Clostridium tagluense TaxID=360422 RepID=UPI001C6EB735|nr:hydrogenase expression/formation protein HypE [Clostridium tagluense]MBW9157166.1 hydrogenase expression/formation protein HypE [Clostridium tagluense]WLC67229.1 hydrogenase expression/formation protein HypE [Clostridium tagluense]
MIGTITLSHGSGGLESNKLINEVFFKYFGNDILNQMNDAAQVDIDFARLAFTTDSFVVNPIFFNGGNIGKLAVCGTVNDLAVSGAKPLYITTAFIIEEGFSIEKLEEIVKSMAEEASGAGVKIVAGDTKVVEKGSVDGIFINTSGIGRIYDNVNINCANAQVGDVIIINGTLGDHGMTIMCERNKFNFEGNLKSDCACLNSLVNTMIEAYDGIHVIRDATRGGVAAVLNEISEFSNVTIALEETKLPLKEEVKGVTEMLGLDPLYIANEGKLCAFVSGAYAEKVLSVMRKHPLGTDAVIIGKVTQELGQKVYLNTVVGGKRLVDMPSGIQLPRIC